jgi:TRASH domain-containing protein
MARIESDVFCDGCGAEITWAPVIVNTKFRVFEYCCVDCAHDIPCNCGERMMLGDELRSRKAITLPDVNPEE